jgi:hypothetical protein
MGRFRTSNSRFWKDGFLITAEAWRQGRKANFTDGTDEGRGEVASDLWRVASEEGEFLIGDLRFEILEEEI